MTYIPPLNSSYNDGEYKTGVIALLRAIYLGLTGSSDTTLSLVVKPSKSSVVRERDDLALVPEFTLLATDLFAFIVNASEDNFLYVKYGTGASASDYDQIVCPGGTIQVNQWTGVVSVFGTGVTGRYSILAN